MVKQELYLGLDLGSQYSQLSYFNAETGEPESVYMDDNQDTYLLPNILFYSNDIRRNQEENEIVKLYSYPGFFAGFQASNLSFKKDGVLVDHIYQKVLMNENVDVDGKTYTAKELLIRLIVLHIRQFTSRYENPEIMKLVVSVTDTDASIINTVKAIAVPLGITPDRLEIVSKVDSGLYYIFNQPESLRNNSVALFDFDYDGLEYYRIDITRNKTPEVITVSYEDFRDSFNYAKFGKDKEDMDDAFTEIVKKLMSETYISSAFLSGVGFADSWMKHSAGELCQGRRVFVGQNIYTKGACYKAVGGEYAEFVDRYFIDTDTTVNYDVGISLMDGKDTFYPIALGGKEWFETTGKISVFLNDTNKVRLLFRHILTKDKQASVLEIHGLPLRPEKTTKLSLEVEYANAYEGAIIIRDEGFGDMFPTTNRIYRKEFDLKLDTKAAIDKKIQEQEEFYTGQSTEELIGDEEKTWEE